MKCLVTGSSGLIGSAVVSSLSRGGQSVVRLLRSTPAPGSADRHWDPDAGIFDTDGLEDLDAVVHLAGESIGAGRWTPQRKARIRESRVRGTRLLSDGLARLARPPRTLISASAIGYYGSRGDEVVDEQSAPGADFLAEVCKAWEEATAGAEKAGVRVVLLRTGVVLSASGGALARMLPPFRLGMGGVVGSGTQYMSWIALQDVVGAIQHAIATRSLSGPVNAVSPAPVTNAEFTRTLGRVLHRPTVLPLPAFLVRLMFGEMGETLLLGSTRVRPQKLQASGYRFVHPHLEGALRGVLGRF